MKYTLLVIPLVAALALVACGGGDEIPEALVDVCTETEDAATDLISVDEPVNGEDVSTPIRVIGDIVPLDGRFWISVVGADGQHITSPAAPPIRRSLPRSNSRRPLV